MKKYQKDEQVDYPIEDNLNEWPKIRKLSRHDFKHILSLSLTVSKETAEEDVWNCNQP